MRMVIIGCLMMMAAILWVAIAARLARTRHVSSPTHDVGQVSTHDCANAPGAQAEADQIRALGETAPHGSHGRTLPYCEAKESVL